MAKLFADRHAKELYESGKSKRFNGDAYDVEFTDYH
jgi:hypothetical protein